MKDRIDSTISAAANLGCLDSLAAAFLGRKGSGSEISGSRCRGNGSVHIGLLAAATAHAAPETGNARDSAMVMASLRCRRLHVSTPSAKWRQDRRYRHQSIKPHHSVGRAHEARYEADGETGERANSATERPTVRRPAPVEHA